MDLYGGTRHSSIIALQEHFTPEQIKRATMHSTNKAFERYFRVDAKELLLVCHSTIADKELITKKEDDNRGKLLKIKHDNGRGGGI